MGAEAQSEVLRELRAQYLAAQEAFDAGTGTFEVMVKAERELELSLSEACPMAVQLYAAFAA